VLGYNPMACWRRHQKVQCVGAGAGAVGAVGAVGAGGGGGDDAFAGQPRRPDL